VFARLEYANSYVKCALKLAANWSIAG